MRVDAVVRGRFTTFDNRRPAARAIAICNERIVALDDEAEALASEATTREDYGELPIFPGFIDAHCHTTGFGIGLGELDLSSPPLASLGQLYEAVAEAAKKLPPGAWVTGGGYDQNKLGGEHPGREQLDHAAGGRPVWLKHTSGHMSVVNSAVLEQIGAALFEPIEGGRVVRREDGAPTGLLQERAQSLVQGLVLPRSTRELAAAIDRAHQVYLGEGITSVCDAGIAGGWIGQSPLELAAYQQAREERQLRVRTTVMLSADLVRPAGGHAEDFGDEAFSATAGLRTGLGDEWLRIGPLKVFADGSLIGRTCYMNEPFADQPDNRGYLQADPEELCAVIVGAHLAGWQVATHAIGDAAVSFALDCYEQALGRLPRPDHRHRIEHCGVTSDASLERLAALGVIPVPQARFVGEIGDGMAAAVGPERIGQTYRLASFLRAGLSLPGSSDRPVVQGKPLLGVADMVRRRTESGAEFASSEALSPEEALRSYTTGSAFALQAEATRGSLGPGKLADFVVLGDDPRSSDGRDIASIPVVATWVGGKAAFGETARPS